MAETAPFIESLQEHVMHRIWGQDIAWFWSQVAQAALQKQVKAWQDLHASKQRNSNG